MTHNEQKEVYKILETLILLKNSNISSEIAKMLMWEILEINNEMSETNITRRTFEEEKDDNEGRITIYISCLSRYLYR